MSSLPLRHTPVEWLIRSVSLAVTFPVSAS